MPESRFISAAKLKPLLVYCALAFVAVVVVGAVLPPGQLRSALVLAWLVLFPVGGWIVFRRN